MQQVFCANCGKPNQQLHEFCPSCGHPIPEVDPHTPTKEAPNLSPAFIEATQEIAPLSPAKEPPPVPAQEVAIPGETQVAVAGADTSPSPTEINYARMVFYMLIVIGASFTLAMSVLNAVVRRHVVMLPQFALALIALIAGIWLTYGWWNRLGSKADLDIAVLPSRRTLLRLGIFFLVVFAVTGGIVGAELADNGMEMENYLKDWGEVNTLTQRIEAARSSDNDATVEDRLAEFQTIKPDVDSLQNLLHQLAPEVDNFDNKFPQHHETTQKTKDALKAQTRRMELIEQEIAIAGELRALSTEHAQIEAWNQKISPLIHAENQLIGK